MTDHFDGKSAAEHVMEKRIHGVTEAHGTEAPGHFSAASDAARDVAAILLLVWAILSGMRIPLAAQWLVLTVVGVGWLIWKAGRSAWLGWSRLERLHRIIEQEKWEIEHHRSQEREELVALYRLKGFEGQLLEDVIDVLMADNDRLLRVMLEEELGLSLESYEHPLKQAVGATVGALGSLILCGLGLAILPAIGLPIGALIALAIAAVAAASRAGNRSLPAIIWALALGALTWAVGTFFLQFLLQFLAS